MLINKRFYFPGHEGMKLPTILLVEESLFLVKIPKNDEKFILDFLQNVRKYFPFQEMDICGLTTIFYFCPLIGFLMCETLKLAPSIAFDYNDILLYLH